METKQIVSRTLETLASLPIQPNKEQTSSQLSPVETLNVKPNTPAQTEWQRKWLKFSCHSPKLQRAADEAQHFCKRWYKNDRRESVLVLIGESGCGKSHLAKAILGFSRAMAFHALEKQRVWDHVPSSWFIFWPEVVEEFKRKEYGASELMRSEDLLIIDDIGAEDDPFKQAANTLCQVLTRREEKFTVITTNIKPEAWSDKFDTRIADRLLRNSVVVDLFGVESFSTM